ncbi:hypothetical protein Sjap_012900 [Stephania japonica]|uniref:Uncharacterized protein n=1 Tax=Stephania japonica TaxID=461633 RepID=A0AAP0IX27_9MAGN
MKFRSDFVGFGLVVRVWLEKVVTEGCVSEVTGVCVCKNPFIWRDSWIIFTRMR